MVFPKRSRQQRLQLFRQIEPNAYYVDSKTMTCVCWQHFTEWSGRIDQCWETLQVLQQVHFIWRNTLWTSTCSVKKRNTIISMRNALTSNVTDLTCRFLVSKAAVCRLVIVEKKKVLCGVFKNLNFVHRKFACLTKLWIWFCNILKLMKQFGCNCFESFCLGF